MSFILFFQLVVLIHIFVFALTVAALVSTYFVSTHFTSKMVQTYLYSLYKATDDFDEKTLDKHFPDNPFVKI